MYQGWRLEVGGVPEEEQLLTEELKNREEEVLELQLMLIVDEGRCSKCER